MPCIKKLILKHQLYQLKHSLTKLQSQLSLYYTITNSITANSILQQQQLQSQLVVSNNKNMIDNIYTQTAADTILSSNRKQLQQQNRQQQYKHIEELHFDNKILRTLPIDKETSNYVRDKVEGACFSLVKPVSVDNPRLVVASSNALSLIDISIDEINRHEFIEYMSGNKLIPGSETAAHCYCGHQFGYFSGQLGDGATMYIGEIINNINERWEIQYKGAGSTPYSRSADGRKVLRSSIREFLCSEHMYKLGIPTTRAATCITSDSKVIRDIYYTGNPIYERCTIITRIAPSFLRFGSFEIFKPTDHQTGRAGSSAYVDNKVDIMNTMINYTIETLFNDIWIKYNSNTNTQQQSIDNRESMILDWFTEVVNRTALLVAKWMSVGWTHAVLNTDNMSIIGITIDYGPFGFMERFDYKHTPNASDEQSRYCYSEQPDICKWNSLKLAEALSLVCDENKLKNVVEQVYNKTYNNEYYRLFRNKLGLIKLQLDTDQQLITDLLDTMNYTSADFTNTFRSLSRISINNDNNDVLQYILSQCASLDALKKLKATKININQLNMLANLIQTNPDMINQFGTSASFIMNEINKLKQQDELNKLNDNDIQIKNTELWNKWINQYKSRLIQDIEYGSKQNNITIEQANQQRIDIQNNTNPRYVLRNYLAQHAIELAENDDYSEVNRLFNVLNDPYDQDGLSKSNATDNDKFAHVTHDNKELEDIDNLQSCTRSAKLIAGYDQPGQEFQCSCSS